MTTAVKHTEIEATSNAKLTDIGEPSPAEHTKIEVASATEHTAIETTSSTEPTAIEATSAEAEHTNSVERTQWPKNSICRAPAHIRSDRESNFEPKLVSIGPYYHGRQNLKRMEDLKFQCISEYLLIMEAHEENYPSYMPPRPRPSAAGIQNRSIYMVSVKPVTKGKRRIDDVPLMGFMDSAQEARAYYKEEFNYSDVEFVRMLFMDSIFIIRTILSLSQGVQESMAFLDVHIKDVRSDLLLLENQIPLFFIKEVYEWFTLRMGGKDFPPFETVLEPFICLDMPWRINHGAMMCSIGAAHFLDLYWRCSLSPQIYMELFEMELKDLVEQNKGYIYELLRKHDIQRDLSEQNRGCFSELVRRYYPGGERDLSYQYRGYLLELVKKIRDELCSTNPRQIDFSGQQIQSTAEEQPSLAEIHLSDNAPMVIPNATELQKMVGIEFKKFKEKDHLHVTFSKGVMRMPRLTIDSRQITLLRNLIAFENYIIPSMRIISCYMKLMDALIDSENDVEFLQKCGVIYNTLSSHEMAATFLNDIGNFCFIDYKANHFSGLYKNVKEYYDSGRNRRWASLHQKYFNSPWAGISVFAAVILLLLSLAQTFYTIYGYHHQKNSSP